MMSHTEKLIYVAAALDVKGSFYIGRYYCNKLNIYKHVTGVQLWVAQKEIADFICDTLNIPFPVRQINKGDSICINFSNKGLDTLLEIITPYLIFKKQHAEILMKYRKTTKMRFKIRPAAGVTAVPPHIEEMRNNLCEEIKKLNKQN